MENHFIFVRKSISLSLSLSLSLEMIFIEWHSNCIETLFWCPNNNNSYDAPIYQKKLSTLSLFASLHLTLQHSYSQSITIYLTSIKICHSRCNLHTIEFYAPWQFVPLFLLKWANPGLFSFIFGLFKQTLKQFYNKSIWKMSIPSSIWCRDSNPRALDHESPPITTRPGLPP